MKNNKRFALKTLSAVTLISISSVAMAMESRVSDAISPGDSNSKWMLGATIGGQQNHIVGEESDNQGFVNVNLEYRGEKFFVSQDEIGYTIYRNKGFSTGVALSGKDHFLYNQDDYDDNQVISHLEERNGTLDAGLYLIHNSDLGQLRFRVLEEITGEHDGHGADASYTFDFNYNDIRINPFVAVNYLSEDSVDYFFGVSAVEATTDLAAYQGKAAVNLTTGVNARYSLNSNWELGFGASVTKLGDGISDSSLVDDDVMYVTSFTANYNF